MSVRAAATIGQATLRGATLGSQDLVFEPGAVQPGKYRFPIGTAGATGLVLHTVYLPLALAGGPSTVTIEGGTHVKASPCFHFLMTTWRAYLALLGLRVSSEMRRPGFYPRGGGLIQADIAPCPALSNLIIDRIEPVRAATGFSAVAGLLADIAKRQARRARYRLEKLGLKVDLDEQLWDGGPGTVVGIELPTAPAPSLFFALGERGKPAERVADDAVDQVEKFVNAELMGVDEHSADQLILPLALAAKPSRFPVAAVSSHLLTNVDVVRRFIDRGICVDGELGKPGRVMVE
jgi:RNA 3'-terminal phosphate cyclase (ATP)